MIQFQNSTPFYGLNLDRLERLKQRICVENQPFYDAQVRQVMGKVTQIQTGRYKQHGKYRRQSYRQLPRPQHP